MDINNLFPDFQYGFLHNRSCEYQLFLSDHDLTSALDNRQKVDMAVLDSSKAFDKAPHQRLTVQSLITTASMVTQRSGFAAS